MPGSYLIDLPHRLVYTRAWGILTDEELLAHATKLPTDPRFKSCPLQLCEFTDVVEVRVTGAGIRDVGQANPWGTGSRRAMVVGSDLIFGLVRMYELMSNQAPEEFQIFRDVVAAVNWLELPSSWTAPPPGTADFIFDMAAELR